MSILDTRTFREGATKRVLLCTAAIWGDATSRLFLVHLHFGGDPPRASCFIVNAERQILPGDPVAVSHREYRNARTLAKRERSIALNNVG